MFFFCSFLSTIPTNIQHHIRTKFALSISLSWMTFNLSFLQKMVTQQSGKGKWWKVRLPKENPGSLAGDQMMLMKPLQKHHHCDQLESQQFAPKFGWITCSTVIDKNTHLTSFDTNQMISSNIQSNLVLPSYSTSILRETRRTIKDGRQGHHSESFWKTAILLVSLPIGSGPCMIYLLTLGWIFMANVGKYAKQPEMGTSRFQ